MIKKLFTFWIILRAFSGCLESERISFVFVGDVMLAGQAGRIMQNTGNLRYPFERVTPVLTKAEIAFGNLECVLTGDRVTPNIRQGPERRFYFKTPPKMAESLVFAGFDVISLANNHTLDGGRKGLLDTIMTLDQLGIKYVGAGKNAKEAYALKVLEVKNRKVGFLAWTDVINIPGAEAGEDKPGIAYLKGREDIILRLIQEGRKKVDILIISVHWGVEGSTVPTLRQKTLARKWIEAGADIIIGHHPHRIQPVEIYKGKLIAYSLGNFVFDSPSPASRKTIILWVEVDEKNRISYKKIPCYITNAQPRLVSVKK